MAVATKDRKETESRDGVTFEFPQLTGTTIYAGTIVSITASGFAAPAADQTALPTAGIAIEQSVNAGASGAKLVKVRKGTFKLAQESGDAGALADVGDTMFAYDDQTVGKTVGSPARAVVGVLVDVAADGDAWVKIG